MNEHDTILDGLKPLFAKARADGLWFFSQSLAGMYWFSPDELEAQHAQGRFIWGAVNWQLRDPAELVTQARTAAAQAQAEYAAVCQRVIPCAPTRPERTT